MKYTVSRILLATAVLVSTAPDAYAGENKFSEQELRAALVGKTINGSDGNGNKFKVITQEDGVLKIKIGGKTRVGTWKIRDDGRWCRTLSSKYKCQVVKHDGDKLKFYNMDGKYSVTLLP